MKVTVMMGTRGRITLPVSVRNAAALKPGQTVEVLAIEGRLEIRPAKRPILTSKQVRRTLEKLRDSRRGGLESA